jgi:hypothetical protein
LPAAPECKKRRFTSLCVPKRQFAPVCRRLLKAAKSLLAVSLSFCQGLLYRTATVRYWSQLARRHYPSAVTAHPRRQPLELARPLIDNIDAADWRAAQSPPLWAQILHLQSESTRDRCSPLFESETYREIEPHSRGNATHFPRHIPPTPHRSRSSLV